ncbi:hypothetical protein GIW70_14625 [Pseudomonas syringae]|nr:hypothetical protein [Pseudomonas syringae]MCF5069422.1 hypothetical protein [Pseudomonas syringae]
MLSAFILVVSTIANSDESLSTFTVLHHVALVDACSAVVANNQEVVFMDMPLASLENTKAPTGKITGTLQGEEFSVPVAGFLLSEITGYMVIRGNTPTGQSSMKVVQIFLSDNVTTGRHELDSRGLFKRLYYAKSQGAEMEYYNGIEGGGYNSYINVTHFDRKAGTIVASLDVTCKPANENNPVNLKVELTVDAGGLEFELPLEGDRL